MPPFSRRANGEIGNAHDPPLIFLINTNLDTVEMLKLVFEKSGFQAAGCLAQDLRSGVVAIDAVCEQLHPSAVDL